MQVYIIANAYSHKTIALVLHTYIQVALLDLIKDEP